MHTFRQLQLVSDIHALKMIQTFHKTIRTINKQDK